jgi:hypothetical protein
MATLHGLFSGTESTQPGALLMYTISGLLVLLLTLVRIFTAMAPVPPSFARDRRRGPGET